VLSSAHDTRAGRRRLCRALDAQLEWRRASRNGATLHARQHAGRRRTGHRQGRDRQSACRPVNQGWTRIEIAVVHAQALGNVVLVASTFAAHGSGANEGKTLAGKSTHALAKVDGVWLSAMHTAA
jgi:hypothetical protein